MRECETGRAWIELDRAALRHNIAALQSRLPEGCRLMPAVKANAYGHGAAAVARECNRLGIDAFCVATVEEGIALRAAQVTGEILVLGYTHPARFPLLREYALTQCILDAAYARQMNASGLPLMGHIKADTGMHRLGEEAKNWRELEGIFQYKNLQITGIFTHLCAAESTGERDRRITEAQAAAFRALLAHLKSRGLDYGRAHLLASYGLLLYPELGGGYARVGIALYGLLSRREELEHCPVTLQPVLSLKARIAQVKRLPAGEGLGYGWEDAADRDRTVAVLAIGYADGVPRCLSHGGGRVLIHGRFAPILGRVCMDQLTVDVTDIPNVRRGGTAVLIGRSGAEELTAYDWAEQAGTVTNEIVGRLGSRLPQRLP